MRMLVCNEALPLVRDHAPQAASPTRAHRALASRSFSDCLFGYYGPTNERLDTSLVLLPQSGGAAAPGTGLRNRPRHHWLRFKYL
jgi:hypothetical protein